jgi:hypothetical protein
LKPPVQLDWPSFFGLLAAGFNRLANQKSTRPASIRAYVMKPLRKTEIERTIRKVLDK